MKYTVVVPVYVKQDSVVVEIETPETSAERIVLEAVQKAMEEKPLIPWLYDDVVDPAEGYIRDEDGDVVEFIQCEGCGAFLDSSVEHLECPMCGLDTIQHEMG